MTRHIPFTSQLISLVTILWFVLEKTAKTHTVVNFVAALLFSAFGIISWRLVLKRRLSVLQHLPGPAPGNIFLGHIYAIFDQAIGVTISQWLEQFPTSNLLYFQGFLGTEYVVPASVQALADVLAERPYDFEKTSGLVRFTKRFLGSGLFIDEGHVHKKNRKIVRPVFQPRRISEMKSLLTSKAEQLAQSLQSEHKTHAACKSDFPAALTFSSVHISEWASRFALDVACIISCGLDLNVVMDMNCELFSGYQRLFACDDGKKQQFLWHNLAPGWLVQLFPSPNDAAMDSAYGSVRDIMRPIVQNRFRQNHQKGEKVDTLAGNDFLSQIVESKQFNEDECVDQMMITLAAAHESTASTISFAIAELSVSPEIQSSLRDELATLQTVDRLLYEDLIDTLPLLNAVCYETIRLHPAIPMTLRKSICNSSIDGESIPPGTYVAIVPEAINKATRFWGPDAKLFKPHRWIKQGATGPEVDPLGGAPSAYCLETFLHGPRGCIGKQLAIHEIKRVVAALVSCFKIESVTGKCPEAAGFLTVKPKYDFRVLVSPVSTK